MIRYRIVWGLERLCTLLDRIPGPWQSGCCPHRLAYLSSRLDERWHTGYWEPFTGTPPEV